MAAYVPLTEFELAEYDAQLAGFESEAGAPYPMERRMLEEIRWQRKTTLALVRNMSGGSSKCRGCEASIYWVKNADGKAYPVTELGLNHFATCPEREQFRKAK